MNVTDDALADFEEDLISEQNCLDSAVGTSLAKSEE